MIALAAPPGAPASKRMRRDIVRMFAQESYHDTFASAVRAFPRGPIAWLPLMAASQARLARNSLQVLIHSNLSQCLLTPEDLRSLKAPVLLMWGDKERLIPADQHAYFRTHLPKSTRIVIVPNMGHSDMAMAPRRVMEPIIDFAANLSPVPRVRRTRLPNISAPRIAVRS